MNKSVLILDTPSFCEVCKFIDYEPRCRCRILSYKVAKIADRFSKLDNCPLRELPEKKDITPLGAESYISGWNDCLDTIIT